MRKIQFRAWTGKKMIGWEHLLTEFTSDWFNNGWQIMQFTGIEDKNGKEIYEGDIIRRYTGYKFEERIREYYLGSINQVKAIGYDFHPSDEVIGNVYENPELLNSEQEDKRSVATKLNSSTGAKEQKKDLSGW